MSIVQYVVYFVLLVGVLIFVHEFGHFLFAKLFNVKVHMFSLGFGPRALAFRRKETEYCVSIIPLGGYVKMLGEDPNDEIRPEDQGRAFHQKPLWQRYIIVGAGPAFNLIFPIFIYLVVFAWHTKETPALVGSAVPGRPAAAAGLKPGDKIVAIEGDEVRYWRDLGSTLADRAGESLRFSIERDGKRFDRYITPYRAVVRNALGFPVEVGRIGISAAYRLAQIGISDTQSPAARAGLKTGDLITSINGRAIDGWHSLERTLGRNRGESLRISFLRPTESVSELFDLHLLKPQAAVVDPERVENGGKTRYEIGIFSAEMFVSRLVKDSPAEKIGIVPGDRLVKFDGKSVSSWIQIIETMQAEPDKEHQVSWVPVGKEETSATFKLRKKTSLDDYRNERTEYIFGADQRLLIQQIAPVEIKNRFSYALGRSVSETGRVIAGMTQALIYLFKGDIPSDSVGSVIMLAHAAKTAAQKGWDHFLAMMALISINLGILNLLPIPVLDGGHIMFFTIEAINRRPLSLRSREIASYVGLILLLSLMVFAFKNDVVRYWLKV